MTDEEIRDHFGTWEYLESIQDENGIDVTQIDELLAMTPTQRLERLDRFLASMESLMPARQSYAPELADLETSA